MRANSRRWGRFFLLILKSVLKSPRIYILAGLCLLFLIVFQNVVFPASYRTEYGIFLDGAEYGQDMLDRLAQDELYSYILLDSKEALLDEVLSGRLDCGFILDSRLNHITDIGNMHGLMDYICSTSTTKGPVLREKVFAAFLMNAAQQMLVSFTTDGKTFAEESEQLTADILASFHGFLDRGETLQVIFETVDVSSAAGAESAAVSGAEAVTAPGAGNDSFSGAGNDSASKAGNGSASGAGNASASVAGNTASSESEGAASTTEGTAASGRRQGRTLSAEAIKKISSDSNTDPEQQEESSGNTDYVPADISLLDRFLALCGTLIFVAAIVFGRTRFSLERKRMVNAMRGSDRAMWSFLSIAAPVMVVDFVITAAYLTGMFIYKSITPAGALTSVGIFFLYGIVCSVWAYVYSLLFHRESMYLGTFIGVIILSLLTCRSFFPLGSLIPVLDVLKWAFPVNYII